VKNVLTRYSPHLFFFIIGIYDIYQRVWDSKWLVTLWLTVAGLSTVVWKRVHWSAGLFFFFHLANGIWLFAKFSRFPSLQSHASFTSFCFMAVVFFVITRRYKYFWKDAMAWYCLVNSILTLIQFCSPNATHGFYDNYAGFQNNGSIGGCLMAITYPFLLSKQWKTSNMRTQYLAQACALFLPPLAILATVSQRVTNHLESHTR